MVTAARVAAWVTASVALVPAEPLKTILHRSQLANKELFIYLHKSSTPEAVDGNLLSNHSENFESTFAV